MGNKKIKNRILAILLALSLGYVFNPSSASADTGIGNFYLAGYGDIDYTRGCSTGYPYLIFDLYKEKGTRAYLYIQRYQNGGWVDTPVSSVLVDHTAIKISPYSSTTVYRVMLKSFNDPPMEGYATCRGSWN